MPDEADPPRKNYGFKDREFKRDNAPKPEEAPMPTAKELAMMAGPVARSKEGGTAKVDDPNDVYNILQGNRAVEQKQGRDEFEIKQIKSRRKRDWLIMMIVGNLTILAAVVLSGFNPVTLIFGLSGLIMFSLSVTWIMWQVMNKY